MLGYLSVSRLDTKQNKYQSCQHPAKRGFQVFKLFSDSVVEKPGTRCKHPVTYSFKHTTKAKTTKLSTLRKGKARFKITHLAEEQNLKPRISKSMVYGFSKERFRRPVTSPQIPSPLPSRALTTPQLCAFTRKPPGFH